MRINLHACAVRESLRTAVLMLAAAMMPAGGAATYTELISWATADAGGGSGAIFGQVTENQTAYLQLSLNDFPRITKIENLNGRHSGRELVSAADWIAAGGGTSITTYYGLGLSGDYLQFADATSDQIWRVHKDTGAIAVYASQAAIMAATGQSSVQILASYTTNPSTGEIVFYEGRSDSILATNGQDSVSVLVADTALNTAFGNDSVSGGMTYDPTGTLYWGNSTNDQLHCRTADGTLAVVLTEAQIQSVTGRDNPGFGDILCADDGQIYFYESTSDNILRFDPADPAGTLGVVLTEEELLNGPAGNVNVSSLGWYAGGLTWHQFGQNGVYVLPRHQFVVESTSLAVAEGGTAVLRIRLSEQPDGPIDVQVSHQSGDTDLSVSAGAALQFTADNWNVYQEVTIAAADELTDTDSGSACLLIQRSSGPNMVGDMTVTVAEIDDAVSLRLSNGATILADPDDPRFSALFTDADQDGQFDTVAVSLVYFGNLPSADDADADDDGLTNAEELAVGTSPVELDSDSDGQPDGWEVANGLDPRDSRDGAEDYDGDGATNVEEYEAGTSPVGKRLETGWNLVSVRKACARPDSQLISETLWYWAAADGAYKQVEDTLEPCSGYWLYALEPCELNVITGVVPNGD